MDPDSRERREGLEWPDEETAMRRSMLLAFVVVAALAGCATHAPRVVLPAGLLDDARFAPPAQAITGDELFALSEPMRRFVRDEMAAPIRHFGAVTGLVEALRKRARLALDYDAERTRNAAEAFEARRGNCLALVAMTAAFADALRLPVRFNLALVPELWSRNADLYVRSGHVNLTIEPALVDSGRGRPGGITIDFIPPEQAQRMRTREIGRETVRAMYMNNRAVEALAEGRLDDAYAWAAGALRAEPGHDAAVNTLGVIYLRHGDLAHAERALRHALERRPDDLPTMSNLAVVLERAGRLDEADAVTRRLAQLEPHPPFHFHDLGRAAMARGELGLARELFEKEAARDPEYHEFQFALAQANFQLGDEARAREHLERAVRNSPSRGERQLYEAKLARLREVH